MHNKQLFQNAHPGGSALLPPITPLLPPPGLRMSGRACFKATSWVRPCATSAACPAGCRICLSSTSQQGLWSQRANYKNSAWGECVTSRLCPCQGSQGAKKSDFQGPGFVFLAGGGAECLVFWYISALGDILYTCRNTHTAGGRDGSRSVVSQAALRVII